MSADAPPTTGEKTAQLLSGFVVGTAAAYVGGIVVKGPLVAVMVLFLGLGVLTVNHRRLRWFSRGVAVSAALALGAVLFALYLTEG